MNMNTNDVVENLKCGSSEEVTAAELVWGLFSTVVFSYRTDSLLKPFPPQFTLEDGEKDISSLRSVVKSMPSIADFAAGNIKLSSVHTDLLRWLLTSQRVSFCPLHLSKLDELRSKTGEHNIITVPEPTHLFEVVYTEQSNDSFKQRQGTNNLLYAYHGSKVENFYSILQHGLHSHLNKTSLFGEGTYLSTEPSVAMGFSPSANTGWNKSSIGDTISVLALCEVIEHPSVKISTSAEKSGRQAPNSLAGDIPDKYIVVTNNDMVRLKYLLVYAKKTANLEHRVQRSFWVSAVQYLHRFGFMIPVLLYGLVLIFISLMSSKKIWRRIKQIYEEAFDNWDWWSASGSFK